MNRLIKPAMLAAFALSLTALPMQLQAQPAPGGGGGGGFGGGPGGGGPPNFDPAAMRQRMMERYKEMLGVESDDDWKVIEPRIQKVTDARREVGFGMGGRFMFGRGRGGNNAGGGGGRRGGFAPEPNPAADALQSAVESNASADTIKAKLKAYREDRAQKQAALEKAQEDLKSVLTVKQEGAAVLAGLID